MSQSNRILVKLRSGIGLAAADPRANLRPLYDADSAAAPSLGLVSGPAWYIADLPEGAPSPWDAAHSQIADQLGIDGSNVLFAEPDLEQRFYPDSGEGSGTAAFAVGSDCVAKPQDGGGHKATGPGDGWHLGDDFSQLRSARESVPFSDPRTRIAHIDTGYDRSHIACPKNIVHHLERNFVDGDDDPNNAEDPNSDGVLDNSGHGTGTIGILAGGQVPGIGDINLGGAPDAEVLPLRIANSVVLFRTSAFARAIKYATRQRSDVVSLSMGGLPSRAWSEAINDAYESGVCIVAAAGNNYTGVPTKHVVYPARYHRTIAACGVMADRRPYDGLAINVLQGNFGPDSVMTAALSAFTPNIPWPVFGCDKIVRMNGEGTSSATPQIAAAVALWYEKYKSVLPRDWRRVEAVRNALFRSAASGEAKRLGRGILRAQAALAVGPVLNLPKTAADSDSFAFFRVLTGLGITEAPPRETMFNIEIMQRWLLNPQLQKIVPDPDASETLPPGVLRKFMDALIGDSGASQALRKHIAARYALLFGSSAKGVPAEVVPPVRAACNTNVDLADPPFRRIRAYAVDPSLSTQLATASMNEVALDVKWEELKPGPIGEYLEIVDKDAAGTTYPRVDLNDPRLLAQDGWAPSEGNAEFHQQMVYAVAMKTIEHFEHALGRPVLWRPKMNPKKEFDDRNFVRRLRVHPHALRQANAYYSPRHTALQFGYFEASSNDPGEHVPGTMVYSCLSHDIIAHETTHAVLDGMHRRFNEASNLDVLAMHEGFADIVALMQHFTIPEILRNEIGRTRGDLEAESILGSLAVQFGKAMGGRGALRDAIGQLDKNGVWRRHKPDPADYRTVVTPHGRGAILVAAVFDAFIAIYKTRTADLLRIYTGGTGVLPSGAIHPDLARRLADEASKCALHVLNMCIRALDYVPPVDITFGEYLRAIITADFDLVGNDQYNYRVAFVEAFRRRGIYPRGLDTLSVDTLRWRGPDFSAPVKVYEGVIRQLKQYADSCFYIDDRKILFEKTREYRQALNKALVAVFKDAENFAHELGLDPKLSFEVHELRRSIRLSPEGRHVPQVIVALTQTRRLKVETLREPQVFRGGSTLIVDLSKPTISYSIVKNIRSDTREERTKAFLKEALRDPLRALLFAPNRPEPFAALHSITDMDRF